MGTPPTPALTVDVVIEMTDRDEPAVVVVRRRNPPQGWALPGGFVDCGETVRRAAVREAREETGLDVEVHALLGVYSHPERDARGHTVSIVFVAAAAGDPQGNDDAVDARVIDPRDPPDLVFDHARIVREYLIWRQRGAAPLPD